MWVFLFGDSGSEKRTPGSTNFAGKQNKNGRRPARRVRAQEVLE